MSGGSFSPSLTTSWFTECDLLGANPKPPTMIHIDQVDTAAMRKSMRLPRRSINPASITVVARATRERSKENKKGSAKPAVCAKYDE